MTDDMGDMGEPGLDAEPVMLPDGTSAVALDLTAVPGYDTLVFDGQDGSHVVISDIGNGVQSIAIDDDGLGGIDRAFVAVDGQTYVFNLATGRIEGDPVDASLVPMPAFAPLDDGSHVGPVEMPGSFALDDGTRIGTVDMPAFAPLDDGTTVAPHAQPVDGSAYDPPAPTIYAEVNQANGQLWLEQLKVEQLWKDKTDLPVPETDGRPADASQLLIRLRDVYAADPAEKAEFSQELSQAQAIEQEAREAPFHVESIL